MPGVRIGNGFAVFIQIARNDAVACADHWRFRFGTGHQAIQPWFESQAVLDDQFCLQQGLGVVRCRLVSVGVGVGADHVGDLNVITTDLMRHVGEDTETGDHLKFFSGRQRHRQHQTEQHE
ncbi:hypothetical protein D3C85_1406160 [compost metagenome]